MTVNPREDIPRINGSSGGFIALVICLVLIIIVSCSAIYYLLRYHEPTEQERAARRRKRHPPPSSGSAYVYKPSSDASSSLWSRVGAVFSAGNRSKGRSRGGSRGMKLGRSKGWIQAGSGDEWDSDSGDESYPHPFPSSTKEISQTPVSYTPPDHDFRPAQQPLDEPFRPPAISYPSTSSGPGSSASPQATISSRVVGTSSPYDDPYNQTPTFRMPPSQPQYPRISSPEPISPSRTPSDVEQRQTEGRQDSQGSVRTFSGGTKFLEAL